jgi:FAD/FMN-containing dehydrogenase
VVANNGIRAPAARAAAAPSGFPPGIAVWRHGYRVRALERAHTWSPLVLRGAPLRSARAVLVDTTRHLTRMRLASSGPAAVVTQTGATMDRLLGFLEAARLGLVAHPAPGDLSVGGVLAIDGYGTAIPARGEHRGCGETFGSVSNLVLSLTAVVWSERRRRYVLRTFTRDGPACASLLTPLGRAFVTEVTLRVGPLRHLRCVSLPDVPADELFAAAGASVRTFASYLEASGRVEAIWYPFTDKPWLRMWTVSPQRPAGSRQVDAPYREIVERYRSGGLYPLNMPVEVRVTGLDHPGDVGVAGAQPALLSAVAPRRDHPGWDVAVWLDILSFPVTPGADRAYGDLERWGFANSRPPYATVRPEWCKGWAYTSSGAWTNRRMIERTLPQAFRVARPPARTWDAAAAALHRLDPHRVFTSPLLRSLLTARR